MTKIDLITGFLGAGKTTFIQKYCRWMEKNGISFAVVENDFGAHGVDSAKLKDSFETVHELSGGCICCSLVPNFTELLLKLCKEKYDRIVVEPSGIFDASIFFSIMDIVKKRAGGEIGSCTAIVDPHCINDLGEEETKVLRSELSGVSSVIWSKCDLPEVPDLSICGEFLKNLVEDDALVIEKTPANYFSQEDYKLLQTRQGVLRPIVIEKMNHGELFHCPFVKIEKKVTKKQAEWFIKHYLENPDIGSILRIKGTMPAKDGGYFAVNSTVCDYSVTDTDSGKGILYFIMKGNANAVFRTYMERLLKELPEI